MKNETIDTEEPVIEEPIDDIICYECMQGQFKCATTKIDFGARVG